MAGILCFFFFSSRRRHTRLTCDWSSDVCSSDLPDPAWTVHKPHTAIRIRCPQAEDQRSCGSRRPSHRFTGSKSTTRSSLPDQKGMSKMELQIGTDEFSRALYRAQGIVEKKSTMPILASVLLEATEDGRLRVSAFDLEIGVTSTHPCEVRKGGSVALKHKELYDIVRALPEKVVVMRREANNRVRLTSGAAEFNIVGRRP